MRAKPISRRQFITTVSAATAFSISSRQAWAKKKRISPNSKMNLAAIGFGGMGKNNVKACADAGENIVALCDVDPNYVAETCKLYPKAKLYIDYREMLEKEKHLDGVIIATPDHTHAVITMAAIQSGLHVYCQKPLTHDIHEARTIARAARESKVVTQMGIQGHSMEGIRLICEWVWSGRLGQVLEVDAWCSLSYYPFGHDYWSSKWSDRPKDTPPLPEKMNWDLWLGPAPERPYHPAYHPAVWRCWWDFGCGMMSDRGVHTLDCVYSALKIGQPETVQASVTGGNTETHPIADIVVFRCPAREGLPPVKVTWYEGLEAPRPLELEENRHLPDEGGVLIKCEKGTIMADVYGNSARLIPETAMKDFDMPAKTLPRLKGSHEQDWIRACKEGGKAGADFEYSARLTEFCLLGNLAKRFPGRLLHWDNENMKVPGLPEADEWIRRPYRAGWTL